jgi:hypothetical protein
MCPFTASKQAPLHPLGTMATVALQLSGHLRGLCDSESTFEPLARVVSSCRSAAARCDLFVHTWEELHPQTSSWHTWYPTDAPSFGSSSRRCVERLKARLHPTAVSVQRQELGLLHNETWIVAAGRHRETHVSLAGLRSAIRAVAAAAELRRSHERADSTVHYDIAVRLRPDIYHRRNFRRSTRANYRGVPMNQICTVPTAAWKTIVASAGASRCDSCVHACDDETAPGNKSGDMCFWSSPPSALDRTVRAWDALADEYLESNLCWQRWRRRQTVGLLSRGRISRVAGGHHLPIYDAGRDGMPPCTHPDTQWQQSAAELILRAAARREKVLCLSLHGSRNAAGDFVPRSADCN